MPIILIRLLPQHTLQQQLLHKPLIMNPIASKEDMLSLGWKEQYKNEYIYEPENSDYWFAVILGDDEKIKTCIQKRSHQHPPVEQYYLLTSLEQFKETLAYFLYLYQ